MTEQALAWACENVPSFKKTFDSGVESHDGREAALLNYINTHPDHGTFANNPKAVLDAIDAFSYQHEFLINIGRDKAGKISTLLRTEKPRTYVEMGGYLGYSAILAGMVMREYAGPTCAAQGYRVWSLELDEGFAKIATELVELAGLQDVVRVVAGPADKTLRRYVEAGELVSVDCLLLDHVEELYVEALENVRALEVLKPGAIVVADNVLRPGAPEYREFVRRQDWLDTWVLKGLIWPGDLEDEIDVCRVKA